MFHKQKRIRDQVIVITGATSGIGLATARAAAKRGAKLVLAARNGDELAQVRCEIEDKSGGVAYVAADVGKRSNVEAIASMAHTSFGGFDTWVNNAGQSIFGRIDEGSDEDHEQLFQVNFWGTVYGSLIAVEQLKKKGGTLINLGSIASDFAIPLQGMYSASKHAIKGFTDALRMELEAENAPINVTLIKPNSINSPLPQRARNYMDREPMLPPPIYPPEEVAYAILNAAEHYRREIIVGGAGAALITLRLLMPELYARLGSLIYRLQRRTSAPRNPRGALYEPQPSGHVDGDQPGYVMKTSAFTRAGLHPMATFGIVAVCAGATAAWLASKDKS